MWLQRKVPGRAATVLLAAPVGLALARMIAEVGCNFQRHLTEQSLRTLGDPMALADREAELEERFVELAGTATRRAIRAYATLTLVRHVYLSTLFVERRPLTQSLLELCEERLAVTRARVSR